MGLLNLVRSKGYKNFMAKLYGWGASVVIIGALFKINHYPGADIMLIIGLGTESIIFFFSAFEPPHVEPDWSLVYPQLAGMYHGSETSPTSGDALTQELDKMLEKAKIGPELIDSLGNGLRQLSETTNQLSNVSNASVANDQYVSTLKKATESASVLTDSYTKTARTLEQSAEVSQSQLASMKQASTNAAALSSVYAQVSDSLKEEVNVNKAFSNSLSDATESAKKFVSKYNESAEILSKTTAALNTTASEGQNYNEQIQKISSNLAALNAMYELHLLNSNEQMENTTKYNQIVGKLLEHMNASVENTGQYKDHLASLNVVVEHQLEATSQQVETAGAMHESSVQFLTNLKESVEKTALFKQEVDTMAKNIAALNKVYGNMLSAMNVNM